MMFAGTSKLLHMACACTLQHVLCHFVNYAPTLTELSLSLPLALNTVTLSA